MWAALASGAAHTGTCLHQQRVVGQRSKRARPTRLWIQGFRTANLTRVTPFRAAVNSNGSTFE